MTQKASKKLTKTLKQFSVKVLAFMLMIVLISNNNVYAAKKLTTAQKKTYKKCLENYKRWTCY